MNLFSLFSGIGAFEKALDKLQIPYELTGFSEIDKYAVKSYCAIHNVEESKNYGDITKIDENALPKNIDLITYGFPCQDISLAGKQKGLFNNDGTQTRSGLFFEALRIIEATKPRIAIAENVKNLTSKKFAEQFKIVLDSLEEAGYNNYWQVLNAKDYKIPQNRERVFIVSIRKDIDTGSFKFPEGFPLQLRLKDMLEAEVDEKFYLSNKMKDYFYTVTEKNKARGNRNVYSPSDVDGISKTITTKEGSRVKDNFIEIYDLYNGRQVNSDVVGTITTGCARNASGTFLVKEATKKGYAEAFEGDSINLEQPNSKTRRGRVGHGVAQTLTTSPAQAVVEPLIKQVGQLYGTEREPNPQAGRIYDAEGISPTMDSCSGGNRMPKILEPAIVEDFYKSREELIYSEYSPALRADRSGLKVVDIPQTVKVRKYPIDTESLCETLRHHKALQNLTNQDIADELDVKVTKVEHWFRKDECFAIPDAEIWYALKNLLKIETNEFDKSIMVFEEKEGVFEKSERHYLSEGIAPTLTSATASEKVIEPSLRIRKLTPKECFRLMGFDDADFEKAEAVNSNTQLYKQAGNSIVVPVVEYIIKELVECGAFKVDKQEEPTPPMLAKTVTFSATLTASELASLNHYMKTRKIEYKVI